MEFWKQNESQHAHNSVAPTNPKEMYLWEADSSLNSQNYFFVFLFKK